MDISIKKSGKDGAKIFTRFFCILGTGKTEEVLEIELGEKLINFQNGKLLPQWKDFNSFLEWYFKLE